MALDVAALTTELNLMKDQDGLSWRLIKDYLRGKVAEAALSGGVVSYTINGRTVTRSAQQLEQMLSMVEKRSGGGLVVQLGEFG
jgi:hypothetical protein